MSRYISEHDARAALTCVGCNKEKPAGQIVCWTCWRGGDNESNPAFVPFKYYRDTFDHWQMQAKAARS